jgi:ABC-type spermidine/putrescine transport system permease subunit II
VVSVVLGVAGALAIARNPAAWARALDSLFMSPLLLPALAFGFAALTTFSVIGVRLGFWTLVIGHVVVGVPFVLRTTIASLAKLDPALLESSASLGAGGRYTFRRVTLPLIARGSARARSSRSWPRLTTSRSHSFCPTRARRCCRSTSGRSSRPASTCGPPPRPEC